MIFFLTAQITIFLILSDIFVVFFYYLLCSSCDVSEYSGFDMDVALGLPEQPLIVPFGKYNRERQKRKTIPTYSQCLSLSVRSRISGALSLSVSVFV